MDQLCLNGGTRVGKICVGSLWRILGKGGDELAAQRRVAGAKQLIQLKQPAQTLHLCFGRPALSRYGLTVRRRNRS